MNIISTNPALKKSSLFLGILVLLTFGNCMLNGFVGDDNFLIVHNTFYRSWENIFSLFNPAAMSLSDEVFNQQTHEHTGSVAFRPALSVTYFLDQALFRDHPAGYHAHNLVLHLLNTLLVFYLYFVLTNNNALSFLGALLFSLHPLKSEPVCGIGYRADLVATFWVLLAFIFFLIRTDQANPGKRWIGWLSHLCFLIALLAKESVAVFPALLIGYDWLVRQKNMGTLLKEAKAYAGYVLILFAYIFIYVFRMKNQTLETVHFFGGGLVSHIRMIFQIFGHYILGFIYPLLVKALPPLYLPSGHAFGAYIAGFGLVSFVFFLYTVLKKHPGRALVRFLIFWFLVCFIPVSNIIPIANPMAYRFMYLGSIGVGLLMALGIEACGGYFKKRFPSASVGLILKIGIIVLCIFLTMALNTIWKSDYVMAYHMIKDFPDNPQGYLHLGIQFFDQGLFIKAKDSIDKSLELGISDPRAYYLAGACRIFFHDKAKPYFEKSIQEYPQFALSYVGLGRIYFLKGDFDKALLYLEKSIQLSATYSAYAYLIQIHILSEHPEKAVALLDEAEKRVTSPEYLESLRKFVRQPELWDGPVDVGL